MAYSLDIPSAQIADTPSQACRLRRIKVQARASQAVVDLLSELAFGAPSERPLTAPRVPLWAAASMEAA